MLVLLNKRQKCLYAISATVLLVGIWSAVNIYQSIPNQVDNMLELEPETTKTYFRSLELYGGKANVVAYEIKTWFGGLWEGESLAYTVGIIAIAVSYAFFCIGYMSGSKCDKIHIDTSCGDTHEKQ